MPKLTKVQKEKRLQEQQERRSLLERRRKKKFDHLKNTGQLGHYYAQKAKVKKDIKSAKRAKVLKEYKPLIIKEDKSLTLWRRIKVFFSTIKKILRR